MPRTKGSKNKKNKKTDEQAKELLNVLSELTQSIKNLNTRVGDLESAGKIPIEEVAQESIATPPTERPTVQIPIPQEFREVVNETLNSQFGINLNYLTDRPEFEFQIVVPEKYSSLSAEEKLMKGADLRTRVITNAESINGVRTWAQGVYGSFSPEVQAQIVADRPSAQ